MKSAIDRSTSTKDSNVIKVSFERRGSFCENENEKLTEDPLEQLLDEVENGEFEDAFLEHRTQDYIHHHQETWDYHVSIKDSARQMSDTLLKQAKRLKEDAKRLKYYLDEMNIDK